MLGELGLEQMEQVLMSSVIGRIGCHADGKTYVVPITFAYDGRRIVCHTKEGQKIQIMRSNPQVCFQVEQIDDLSNWRSVIVQGVYEELQGYESAAALGFLIDRVAPLITSRTTGIGELRTHITPHGAWKDHNGETKMVVFAIRVQEKTGRFEKGA